MDIQQQLEIIKRGAAEIVSEAELKEKLAAASKNKKPLVIKAGFDPTTADLHLGHTVLLRKLRQFQGLGHKVVFLIGDFTGRIGDPTGRSEIRKQLGREEVRANAATYKSQVSKILDTGNLSIVFNSEWFEKMSMQDMLGLTTRSTVAQMLARDDFKKRYARSEDISLLEFMYPLLQGYDSVKLEADVEIGGTDQIFNLLMGRQIQRDFGQSQQVVITMPLLEGTDGVQKMSKTFNNYIGINEPAKEMFGKIMSISDTLMMKYYELLTDEDMQSVKGMHPREAKLRLAEIIVGYYHDRQSSLNCREEFERVFSQGEVPADIPVFRVNRDNNTIIQILLDSGLVSSKNEARRLIQQGGICFGKKKIESEDTAIVSAGVLKVGKRRFLRLEVSG